MEQQQAKTRTDVAVQSLANSIIAQIGPLELQRRNATERLDALYAELKMLDRSRDFANTIESRADKEFLDARAHITKMAAKQAVVKEAPVVQQAAPTPTAAVKKKTKAKPKKTKAAKATGNAPRKRGRPPGTGKKSIEEPGEMADLGLAAARPSKPNGTGAYVH